MNNMDMFRKQNQSEFSDAFFKEAEGLRLLEKTLSDANVSSLKIPEVYSVNSAELSLQKIQCKQADQTQMVNLGESLASMHKIQFDRYGFKHDNCIGLSLQPNVLSDQWGAFFVEYRLAYQVSKVQDRNIRNQFEQVLTDHQTKLELFLTQQCEHPSLLHGDLWSGNVLFDSEAVWLIDPAVYFGDREADLAMTEMFGGFTPEFYRSYDSVYPRSTSYSQKAIIYNLYHYLNHYNLFGDSYLLPCQQGFDCIKNL